MSGLSQEEFCEYFGWHRRTLVRYESKEREPSFNIEQLKKLEKLLKVLNKTITDLPDKFC